MKSHWHETIQQYADGQSSAEDAAALRKGLSEDADLRALYLDYMNLDMALSAMADAAAVEENGSNRITSLHEARAGSPPHFWRWAAAAAAAFAALVVFAMLPRVPKPLRTGQDVAAAITSSQGAIARLAFDSASALPAWMSPTASLLEPPRVPEWPGRKHDNTP
jgi:anti-sigma factor RsiW